MQKVDFNKNIVPVGNEEKGMAALRCIAHGCPRTPTLFMLDGIFCRYHYGKKARDWPTITNWLVSNKQDIDAEEKAKGYVNVA